MSTSNGNNEADASSAGVSTGNAKQESNEPVFAVPALPVRKSTAMGPPPPPLFPKEQRETSNVKENATGSSSERTERAPPPSKEPGTSTPSAPPLKYQKPAWSGYPNQQFFFEVIKNGVIVEKLTAPLKEFLTVGRLPMCDLEMAHPSLSRYHAVVQFKSSGECFIYDLNSSHGTKLNKNKIPPGMHVALKPGDQLRFGESTRIYLFQTEEEVDQEEEERKLVNAMIEKQNRPKTQQQRQQHEDDEEAEFNWGMAPDAVDEDEDEEEGDGSIMEGAVRRKVDPDASYRNDPKKALRNYLQNKGYSCDFEIEESGPGHAKEYTARIRLPIETSMGPVYGQATAGKKRDAEREAALDACIQLDSRGMLGSKSSGQKSGEDSLQGKSKYDRSDDDDDDDDFYDRTVKKKSVAARKAEQKADTYESLLEKHRVLLTEMAALETKIQDHDTIAAERKRLEESGDLDGYMALLEKSGGDSKPKMQQNLSAMKKEEKRLLQLIELTKPVDILAKIGAGAPAKGHNNTEPSSNSAEKKRPIDDNTPTTGETKKPRVLGPSLPPPAS